ncbi:MAG: hypothetical protein JW956_11570, partial [Calditrichaceae bacterium]|nr:hypothetical protein [Calditrichaceae bacterium]
MKKIIYILFFVILPVIYAKDGITTEVDSSLLTIDRIFLNREFSAKGLGQTQWFDYGDSYAKLESSENLKSGEDIVKYDVQSGKREIIVPAE